VGGGVHWALYASVPPVSTALSLRKGCSALFDSVGLFTRPNSGYRSVGGHVDEREPPFCRESWARRREPSPSGFVLLVAADRCRGFAKAGDAAESSFRAVFRPVGCALTHVARVCCLAFRLFLPPGTKGISFCTWGSSRC